MTERKAYDEKADQLVVHHRAVYAVGFCWAAAWTALVAVLGGSAWIAVGVLIVVGIFFLLAAAGGAKAFQERYGKEWRP